jgi:hypothetical protein
MNGKMTQPIISGVSAAVGTWIFAPEVQSLTLPLVNADVNGPLAVGLATAVSSGVGQMLTDYVTPNIQDSRYSNLTSTLLPPIATGVIAGGLVAYGDRTGGGQVYNAGKVGMIAFGAHVIGNEIKKAMDTNMQ